MSGAGLGGLGEFRLGFWTVGEVGKCDCWRRYLAWPCLGQGDEANCRHTRCERLVKTEAAISAEWLETRLRIGCSEVALVTVSWARDQRLSCRDIGGAPETEGWGSQLLGAPVSRRRASSWNDGSEGETPSML